MTTVEVTYFEEKLRAALVPLNRAIEAQRQDSQTPVEEHLNQAAHELYLLKQALENEKKWKQMQED